MLNCLKNYRLLFDDVALRRMMIICLMMPTVLYINGINYCCLSFYFFFLFVIIVHLFLFYFSLTFFSTYDKRTRYGAQNFGPFSIWWWWWSSNNTGKCKRNKLNVEVQQRFIFFFFFFSILSARFTYLISSSLIYLTCLYCLLQINSIYSFFRASFIS